jgi:urease accessory protein UreH
MMPKQKKARRPGFGDRKQPLVSQRPKEESSIWVPAPRMQYLISRSGGMAGGDIRLAALTYSTRATPW